ncbi:molybdate ABC transporter permease subunit [Adlercreutzia sp. R25]|uniref:molybdate ABC transporter permease subunit n=1 Tax=Adlercreutzia shanghongiae TaxID=3111773 RepID=UPI002DBFA8A0|nr:molybdate ABC transporter permease subunit [Adlercreutzia sp. R25]MEC4273309.1 molybdate ABC transporter permease subunit [Adlercreutzia sp. R25]
MVRRLWAMVLMLLVLAVPAGTAWADGPAATSSAEVEVAADGDAARMEGCSFAAEGFECSRTGSAREIDGRSYGYTYRLSDPERVAVANTADCAVMFIPRQVADQFGIESPDDGAVSDLWSLMEALDSNFSAGVVPLRNQDERYVLIGTVGSQTDTSLTVGEATFTFAREIGAGRYYVTIEGPDAAYDVKAELRPAQMDSAHLVPAEGLALAQEGTPLEQLGEFLATMDYSPLWVTLRTSGVAIVFVFFLGLAAAYFTLRISKRAQNIFDTVFTIPMVLPPTVCGFLLLSLLGRNTAFGRFFQDIGFPLAFSWQATVIAAVVVAFPLMYRSARGAFESLDPNMLDAARTLGWSNGRIFMRLMLPLAWSSIASGTVLAFARALGEFGCTLFLAGNQLGSTRTIPIAIYFEWMNGNTEATWFWTIVLMVFSFLVIMFINLWSRHTTRYRQRSDYEGRSPKPRRNGTRGGGRRGRAAAADDGLEEAERTVSDGLMAEGGER